MSKPRRTSGSAYMILILVFAALIAFILVPIFLLFFVPIICYYVWKLSEKAKDLDRRLSALENPAPPNKEATG